jgi:hypothetical protein
MPLSKIVAKSITDDTITTDQIADTAVHGRRNVVINGACQVAQRGDVTGITGANVFGGADRFATNGGSYGTVSLVQEADAPEGFAESQRVKFTTARSTTGAGDHFVIGTRLEGQDLQRFKKGTSNAESMTVSFYAKASQATTIQLELFDADNNRHAGKEFAITTSWARYSYSFAGDTTGAFDNDNAVSLYVFFWLGAGTTFTSGTNPDGSWISNDNPRRVHSDVGTTFMDTLNAEFNLTGVQLEVGEQATPFEHRSYGEELSLCQRYYVEFRNSRFIGGYKRHDVQTSFKVHFPVSMRATPTVTLDDGGSFTNFQSVLSGTQSSPVVFEADAQFNEIVLAVNSTYSGTHTFIPSWESQEVTFDAEL